METLPVVSPADPSYKPPRSLKIIDPKQFDDAGGALATSPISAIKLTPSDSKIPAPVDGPLSRRRPQAWMPSDDRETFVTQKAGKLWVDNNENADGARMNQLKLPIPFQDVAFCTKNL